MANKWIQHVKQYSKNNNIKYNDALKDPNCKSSYKKGMGIMENGMNYLKNEGKKYLKSKVKNLVDTGADMIKDTIGNGLSRNGKMQKKGNGLFGDITKGVTGFVLDNAPLPNVVKDIGKIGSSYLIDRSGMGIMKRSKKGCGSGALYMA